jgi:hypothetical protein
MSDMKKIKKKQQPVLYRLQIGFKLKNVDDAEGTNIGGDFEFPIRKGFGEKLGKIKKGDVVSLLHQIAEAVEKEDYSILGLPTEMFDMTAAARKTAAHKAN